MAMAMALLLLLLLLTPNKILKKTENRVLLSVSEWGPSTDARALLQLTTSCEAPLGYLRYADGN